MGTLFIVALVLFVLGLALVAVPSGQFFRAGTALALVAVGLVVFLPALVKAG